MSDHPDERARFEAWLHTRCNDDWCRVNLRRGDYGQYLGGSVEAMWNSWQARAGHPAPHDLLPCKRHEAFQWACHDCCQVTLLKSRPELGSCSSHSTTAPKDFGAAEVTSSAEPSSLSGVANVADQTP